MTMQYNRRRSSFNLLRQASFTLFLAPAVEPKWQDSPPHFVKRYREHSCIVWYIFPGGRQTSFNKRYKLTSCAVQSTTKLNTAFKPISFPSMFRCHVQTLHQKCVAGCQAKYYLTESHCPNTISSDFQIFSMLLTLFSCAYLPHYFTLYFKLYFYSATASFNNISRKGR